MSHCYTQLLYHILFSTRKRRPFLRRDIRRRVYDYIGGTVRGLGGIPLEIGGVEDHVHILAQLPPTLNASEFVGKLKANSSKWIKQICKEFAWQEGYTAFTVSRSQLQRVRIYIRNQERHHRKTGFAEEWSRLLEAHGIATDDGEEKRNQTRTTGTRPARRPGTLVAENNGPRSPLRCALGQKLPPAAAGFRKNVETPGGRFAALARASRAERGV
ncbi:MAG: IS200/IS605 family transposase [Acidobacteria bacterium]|nr:IS200/IS605 family transposase [Acidobacteriota bacterium]